MSFRNYYESSSSSYSRNRDTGRTASNSSVERPTSVTAKYINNNSHTPSYKSSSIPILSPERTQKHEEHEKTPIATIQSRYANYNKTEKPSTKYDKKDYSKLTVPSVTSKSRDVSRDGCRDTKRDVSPISTVSKYSSLTRPSRHLSPERRITKSFKEKHRDISPGDRDKDIPSKTDKSSGYNSLSSYKLYPRTSNYTRPTSRAETKPEITVNRYAIANRLNSTNYLRSPPTIKRPSVSPVSINHIDIPRNDIEKPLTPTIVIEETNEILKNTNKDPIENLNEHNISNNEDELETETVTIITRHTSPTPPGSSSYVRSRRADMAKTIEKTLTRLKKRPVMLDKEIQSDRLDDPIRTSRFGSTARTSMTNWSYYSPNSSSYTGYAGRYSTQYSSLRENSSSNSYNDRSSRSHSTELQTRDNMTSANENSKEKSLSYNNSSEQNHEVLAVYDENKDEDTSEIIINVNLKLKRAKSPVAKTELISPEITITNSQLPPQAPKSDSTSRIKKSKIKKSSTDSSTDSNSKKKIVKKRSKSVSSTDSDQGSELSEKTSPPRSIQKTSSSSNLQNDNSKLQHSKSRDSNSPESSITLSTQSSISEDESICKSKTQDISRTTADEVSIPTDRSVKNEGTEEAKSFLIRALAPVTNLFKMRHQDSSENVKWLESSSSEPTSKDISNLITESEKSNKSKNIIASNDDGLVRLKSIRPIKSGDRSTWLELDTEKLPIHCKDRSKSLSDKNIPKTIRHVESGERARWQESNNVNSQNNNVSKSSEHSLGEHQLPKKCKFLDEEKPWWLDSSANIPEGIERLTPPRNGSTDSEKNEKYNFFKVRRNESGDHKDWWLTSNDNSSNSNKAESHSLSKSGSDRNFPLRRIRHIESGERPWWLSSSKNIPEGIEKLPTPPPEDSESSDEEVEVYIPTSHIPPFPLHLPDDEPLGDRRSPEGLEMPKENEHYRGRSSPYENNRQCRRRISAYKTDRYISRYTDIDDILGMSGQIYSPFMDSILARRMRQMMYDEEDCEEIDPTQVRIHDSTAQRPVIKKIHSRSEIIDCMDEEELDDAALQVFKDGDYGPYLDLDSTLGEQDEEIEGLQDNRKSAIVLRTQLSVRVHAIIERLLHSQGKELRRALFALKQILQSDNDLVHEFVANKGLDCLMQVGNAADHNYLDYILRALGQILLYVDGMHGVMEHKHCVSWLYSLISSKFRHVVKTVLKLLLVFVEYTEKNCVLLVDAIVTIDISNGRLPWFNIMKILQNTEMADTELLIYATTLINRCLNNMPDINTYYDQVDALYDQGMDQFIRLHTSKQGTDLDLLRQMQIFEAVLHYEDGDESGTALKQLDESIITCLRRRSLNLTTTERRKSKKQLTKDNLRYTAGLKQRIQNGTLGHTVNAVDTITVLRQQQMDIPESKDERGIVLNMEHSIKDIAQRLTNPVSPSTEEKLRVSDMAGIVSKAKEELAKSQSKEIIKSPIIEKSPKVHEIKVTENEFEWEAIKKRCINREYHLCDLDFTDLRNDSDDDMALPTVSAADCPPPPPPPAMFPHICAPPPPPGNFLPKVPNHITPSPKPPLTPQVSNDSDSSSLRKNKKTVKLFWREIQDTQTPSVTNDGVLFWDNLPQISLDTNILEHLFESKTNDLILKEKLMEPKRTLVLDPKRSNAINIAMKKLPTPQTIKAAILKMDATIIGREGIEKLLTMLPTEEEKGLIQEAQLKNSNADLPLGSAEQFLLTLASINELPSRLKLWVFKLDFENSEKEIAEPLMDLKQGLELLKENETFKIILATLRSMGSFLNGTQVKGFRLEYLSKVMEVKDTVQKHPLLYHVCDIIMKKFPSSTDFFNDVGPLIRAAKVDFDELDTNLVKLEADCKASWDHMKKIAKHDGSQMFNTKITEFLINAAERIILLTIIRDKVMNRFRKFLSYLGVPPVDIVKTKPTEYLKVIAEFALEYRTTRERVLQQNQKKANHRERNKTRGKMIIDMDTSKGEITADSALKALLTMDPDSNSLTERRRKSKVNNLIVGDTSADDEIIETLVRSATSKRRVEPRDRTRKRLCDKINLNRTLDGKS
ncbi:hypothetical protein K1T71_000489 [Dendrolimus kikuchii]|uniref:Uncharacterized protein n=1 Tax=Dendrolimus kikuchii TaxID=765133 RepID=A0ACC1DKQ3_9NEOP|nr:hypothetical protein K1T71_000489 [Dendrolimus kikuchii]